MTASYNTGIPRDKLRPAGIAIFLFSFHNDVIRGISAKGGVMRKGFFAAAVAIVSLAAGSCVVLKPRLSAREVFTHPGINFRNYKDVAVYVDLANLPWENRHPLLISAFENALAERGFHILGFEEFVDFTRRHQILAKEVMNPRVLALIKKETGKSAVVRFTLNVLKLHVKETEFLRIVTPGVPGYRWGGVTPIDLALRDRHEWVIDVSLAGEMHDTESALKIWSCSMSGNQTKYEGLIEDFLSQAAGICLDTIPSR